MLTIKKHALKLGALGLVLGISFAACSDDDDPAPTLRSKEYKLTGSATSTTQVGTIKLIENRDSSVDMTITINKTTASTKHPYQLLAGTVAAPTETVLLNDTITGTGNAVTKTIWKNLKTVDVNGTPRKFNYDSAIAINAFAKVKFSATKDSIIAIGNIWKSAQ
ncbi:MAG TPA: hypothetical protein VJ720_13845 [Chitinophaga sp.]|nr:hypothetical protein [Chitinophaga sp.]